MNKLTLGPVGLPLASGVMVVTIRRGVGNRGRVINRATGDPRYWRLETSGEYVHEDELAIDLSDQVTYRWAFGIPQVVALIDEGHHGSYRSWMRSGVEDDGWCSPARLAAMLADIKIAGGF